MLSPLASKKWFGDMTNLFQLKFDYKPLDEIAVSFGAIIAIAGSILSRILTFKNLILPSASVIWGLYIIS